MPPLSPNVQYDLPGDAAYQAMLYPPPEVVTVKSLKLTTQEAVIAHYTASSLKQDGIEITTDQPAVSKIKGKRLYRVSFTAKSGFEKAARQFAKMHATLLDAKHAGQGINGALACQATPGAWNPMSGFPVNRSDGECLWRFFLPLGMPILNHKAVTLLHYPPYVAMQHADYLKNVTLQRWQRLLGCVGIQDPRLYYNILDVNPIAAPGSGQSEYPNDYFPIMLASVFFDNEKTKSSYIRSMLELALNPPHNAANPHTLPLLVGGSPLYDPQAPGWFRVRYKNQMPKDKSGIPQANVGQCGFVRIHPKSKKLTPYMIANHMIAAGVTGRCTSDPSQIPDIRKYTAQDLVAASFLKQYADNPSIKPDVAGQNAFMEWFGAKDGSGAPKPAADKQKIICINSQIDLFFDVKKLQPMYTWEEAEKRCTTMSDSTNDPCCGACAPPASA